MNWLKGAWDYVQRTVSPRHFYDLTGRCLPGFAIAAALLLSIGTVWGLAFAPPDYQQGNSYRIMFIHVPAAFIAMNAYVMLAACGVIALVWKVKTAEMVGKAIASVGAWFCFISLFTGAVWGKPTWGTYWVWDARLTSMLILLFLYMGVLALQSAYEDAAAGSKAAAILSIVGVINLPIIHYSVVWWNTLHQGSSFSFTKKPDMPPSMWEPLLIMLLGSYALFVAVIILRARNEILFRERRTRWVRELLGGEGQHGL